MYYGPTLSVGFGTSPLGAHACIGALKLGNIYRNTLLLKWFLVPRLFFE